MSKTKSLILELEEAKAALSVAERDLLAFREWFICETLGHSTVELDVTDSVRVVVHGIARAAGGVAVVVSPRNGGRPFRDQPRLLDDLCSEWSRDSAREIREAAAKMLRRRGELLDDVARLDVDAG